jgi:hypothetical protein
MGAKSAPLFVARHVSPSQAFSTKIDGMRTEEMVWTPPRPSRDNNLSSSFPTRMLAEGGSPCIATLPLR